MIYLDSAATSKLSPHVQHLLARTYTEIYGNNSSKHPPGLQAAEQLRKAKKLLGAQLNCHPADIYITSGSTEAANILLQGYAKFLKRTASERRDVIISSIEHPAVYHTAMHLKTQGFNILQVPVNREGQVSEEVLSALLSPQTAMVAIIQCNHETGAVQDIEKLSRAVKDFDEKIYFLTDVTQGVTKVPLNLSTDYVDAYFLSGHKIGAPKGCGLFYHNPRFRILPISFGGGQERSYRPGTVDVAGAVLLAEALVDRMRNFDENATHVTEMRNTLLQDLGENGIPYRTTLKAAGSPYILSLSFDMPAKRLVAELAKRNICVSMGSACSSNSQSKSRILEAMGVRDPDLSSTIRVSFSPESREDEVLQLSKALSEICERACAPV